MLVAVLPLSPLFHPQLISSPTSGPQGCLRVVAVTNSVFTSTLVCVLADVTPRDAPKLGIAECAVWAAILLSKVLVSIYTPLPGVIILF